MDDEIRNGLDRMILRFNTHQLFAQYAAFKLILNAAGCAIANDADAIKCILQYFTRLDKLWFDASCRLRERHSLSDACVRRLFRSVSQRWLLRFMQGDESITGVSTYTSRILMRELTDEERRAELHSRPDGPGLLLKLGETVQYTVTYDDLSTTSWVEGQSYLARPTTTSIKRCNDRVRGKNLVK